jgi:hypothetical protein
MNASELFTLTTAARKNPNETTAAEVVTRLFVVLGWKLMTLIGTIMKAALVKDKIMLATTVMKKVGERGIYRTSLSPLEWKAKSNGLADRSVLDHAQAAGKTLMRNK